jgi:hypothetical protein
MRWLVFFGALVALLVGLLLLPQPASTLIILLLLLISLAAALNRAGYPPARYPALLQAAFHRLYQRYITPLLAVFRLVARINLSLSTSIEIHDNPPPTTRKPFLLAAEIAAILLMVAYATRPYYQSPGLQLSGSESEWLTSSAYAAHNGLRDYGRIPLWQPYLEFGEPLVDNPFSFIVNPFSSVPSLLLGGAEGMKLTVVVTTALAGLGGWFLGYVLGFAWVGRLLLGMLLVGKGNMLAMFNTGYFQLASSQAYFPWIIAGIVSVFTHTRHRWPPVLLAVSAAMLLFAGNLWYTLPMFIGAAAIVLVYLLDRRPVTEGKNGERFRVRVTLRLPALKALILAAVLTIGISAVILLPVWTNQGHIGKHPPEVKAGWVVPLLENIIPYYFNPDPGQSLTLFDPTNGTLQPWWTVGELAEHYYSFITPLWFLALICVAIPLYRPRWHRLACLAWVMAIFFTLWGAGGQLPFLWLYQAFPFIRGWRFVGRALAVASFWIALLVAMRLDSLWRIITTVAWDTLDLKPVIARWLPRLLSGLLLLGSAVAAYEVNQSWYRSPSRVLNPIHADDTCVSWLRAQYPDQPLTIWRNGYEGVTTLMQNRVRIFDVTAAFEMSPLPSTIASIDLTQSPPEFALPWSDAEWQFLAERGYVAVDGSPPLLDTGFPCLYRKPDTLAYAYTVPLRTLQAIKPQPPFPYGNNEILPPSATTPVTAYLRQPDNILLAVAGDPSGTTVLTLQERAYPGWHVTIDGQPAKLQSVGGQLGILLPSQPGLHQIYFEYRPPLLITSAWITLIASLFAILYLLRAERFLPDIFRLNRHKRHNRNGERSEN